MPRVVRPTVKMRKWAKYTAMSGDPTDAALKVYDTTSRGTAKQIALENITRPMTKALLEEELSRSGLDRDSIAAGISKIANDATSPVIYEGEITTEYPDHATRLRALRTAAELIDAFPSKKTEHKSMNVDLAAQLTDKDIEALLEAYKGRTREEKPQEENKE